MAADLPPSSRVTGRRSSPQRPAIPPRGRAAGEAHLVDAGMPHEVLTDLTSRGDDVHYALGQRGGFDRLGEHVREEGGLRRGLEDHGAPGGERGRELRDRDEEGHVPRDDRADDADWLAQDPGLAEDPLAQLVEREGAGEVGVVREDHRGGDGLDRERERDRRPDLGGDDAREFLGAEGELLVEPRQGVGAVARRHAGPGSAVEGGTSRRDGAVDVGGGAVGDDAHELSVRRRPDLDLRGAGRRDELPADVELLVVLIVHASEGHGRTCSRGPPDGRRARRVASEPVWRCHPAPPPRSWRRSPRRRPGSCPAARRARCSRARSSSRTCSRRPA